MQIAVYGGSFNPVGNHHVEVVKALLGTGRYERVAIVPNGNAYTKAGLIHERHRLAMCRLAFAGMEKVHVSDLETGQPPGEAGGDMDALRALKEKYAASTAACLAPLPSRAYRFTPVNSRSPSPLIHRPVPVSFLIFSEAYW